MEKIKQGFTSFRFRQTMHRKEVKRQIDYIIIIVSFFFGMFVLSAMASCTHPNPPGVDPENYDYPTPAELDSIWRVEASGSEVFR